MSLYQATGVHFAPKLIPVLMADHLKACLDIIFTDGTQCFHEPAEALGHSNEEVPSLSKGVYGHPVFDALITSLLPTMEQIVERKLLPTYSYARIYEKGASLAAHKDRPTCEHSISLNLGGCYKDLWPLWFTDQTNETKSANMDIGDAAIYKGDKVLHWRDTFSGERQYQLFIHYVEADGENKHQIYDGRPALGMGAETRWGGLFPTGR